jgi:integrin alpha FG-GAP repeat containing protein 1
MEPKFNGKQCSRLANPHSNAVVDLDGDCLAGIFASASSRKEGDLKHLQICFWCATKVEGRKHSRFGSTGKRRGTSLSRRESFQVVPRVSRSVILVQIFPSLFSPPQAHTSFIDRDGTIDMLITTCPYVSRNTGLGTDCEINIAYNKQLSLCASSTDTGFDQHRNRVCRPHYELCTGDEGFKFDLRDEASNEVGFLHSCLLKRMSY